MTDPFVLEVIRGKESGQRYPIPVDCYLVIARRASDLSSTMEIAAGGDHLLGEQAIEIAERFIAARGGRSGPRHRLGLRTRVTDVEIDDAGVSRTHAMIFHDRQGLSVVDLMSTNGTFINEAPVTDADLEEGDMIRIGETELRVARQG